MLLNPAMSHVNQWCILPRSDRSTSSRRSYLLVDVPRWIRSLKFQVLLPEILHLSRRRRRHRSSTRKYRTRNICKKLNACSENFKDHFTYSGIYKNEFIYLLFRIFFDHFIYSRNLKKLINFLLCLPTFLKKKILLPQKMCLTP